MLSVFAKEVIVGYVRLKPHDLHPHKILHHLNRQYRRNNYPDDYFIYIFLAVLDLDTREMRYAGAGFHDSPLAKLGTGEQLKLVSKGLPISCAIPPELVKFEKHSIILTPGTTLLFNTDGLTEQKAGDLFYGDRLQKVFYANSHLSPEYISLAIKEDFRHFNKGSLQGDDDITLVIIQVDREEKEKYGIWNQNLHFARDRV